MITNFTAFKINFKGNGSNYCFNVPRFYTDKCIDTFERKNTPGNFSKISFHGNLPEIKLYGNVSNEFVTEITEALKLYPIKILNAVMKGNEVRLSPRLSDAFPDSPEMRYRVENKILPGTGYTENEACCGHSELTVNGKPVLNFCEAPSAPGSMPANRDVVGHEITHKVDKINNKIFSQSDIFKEAVKKDLQQFEERQRKFTEIYHEYGAENADYTIQGSTPDHLDNYGLGEIFAEIGASLTTSMNTSIQRFMTTFFPEATKIVEEHFNFLEATLK